MEIKTNTINTISFRIRAFWNEEGGMGEESFGKEVHEFPEALQLLQLADASRPDNDWMIVCDVKTKTVKKLEYTNNMTDEQKENLNTKIAAIRDENYSNYGHSTIFDYHSDTIDSRDIQERIDELQSEFDSHVDEYEESDGEEYAGEDLLNWLEENGDEFVTLLEIKEEVEQYTREWNSGAFMIADNHFEDYAQELAEDTGAIDRKAKWPLTHIDWDAAAEELKCDYSEITIDGKSYWIQ